MSSTTFESLTQYNEDGKSAEVHRQTINIRPCHNCKGNFTSGVVFFVNGLSGVYWCDNCAGRYSFSAHVQKLNEWLNQKVNSE